MTWTLSKKQPNRGVYPKATLAVLCSFYELPSPSHSMRARVCQSPRGGRYCPGRGRSRQWKPGWQRASSQHRPQPHHTCVHFMVYRLKANPKRERGGTRPGSWPQAATMAKCPRAGSDMPASVNHQAPRASPNATSSYLALAATPVLDSGRVTRATTVRSRCLCRGCQCACARPTE